VAATTNHPQPGRVDQRHHTLRPTVLAWTLLVAAVLLAVGCWHLSLVLSGGPAPRDLGATLTALLAGRPVTGLPPGDRPATSLPVLATVALVLWVPCTGALAWAVGAATPRKPGKGLATRWQVRNHLGETAARRAAAWTRPGLDERAVACAPVTQIGWPLATQVGTGEPVVLDLETALAVMAPTGSRKTRMVVIPAVLDAPGPVVVTSTRADLLDVVAAPRSRRGRVWVFDPMDRTRWPDPMVWDPVAGCVDGLAAIGRARAFAGERPTSTGGGGPDHTNAGFFRGTSGDALARLLHAAALDGRPLAEVIGWGVDLENAGTPIEILGTHPAAEPGWAGQLRSLATGADDTVASTRQTLQTTLGPFSVSKVLDRLTPGPGVPVFDPAGFVTSTDTLVIVSDNNSAVNCAPLATMLLWQLVDAAKTAALSTRTGRLTVPLRLVLDEVANIAPLPELPDVATDIRAYGIQTVYVLQSHAQVEEKWGRVRARMLIDNAPAVLVLGGLKDDDALERFSRLAGQVEVQELATSYDQGAARRSVSQSIRERRVLRSEEIRMLAPGTGLLLYTAMPAALVRLTDWTDRADADQLHAGRRDTIAYRLEDAR
jgi:hypothetical protein